MANSDDVLCACGSGIPVDCRHPTPYAGIRLTGIFPPSDSGLYLIACFGRCISMATQPHEQIRKETQF